MQKNSFVLQTRLNAVVAKLSDKQAGLLFKSILNYAANGTVANFEDSAVGIAFEFVRQDIDYTASKYAEICEKRKEAIQKRWNNTKDTNVYKSTNCNTNEYKPIHNDNEYDDDNELLDKSNNKEKERKEKEKFSFVADDFKATFDKWLAYKKERKESYKGAISVRQCYNRLVDISGNNAAIAEKIVNQSMANNWAGLFPLKEGGAKNGGIDYNGKDADLSKYIEYERKNTKIFYNK